MSFDLDFTIYFAQTVMILDRNPPEFSGAIVVFFPSTPPTHTVVSVRDLLDMFSDAAFDVKQIFYQTITPLSLEDAMFLLKNHKPGSRPDTRHFVNFGEYTPDELLRESAECNPEYLSSLLVNLCGYTFETVDSILGPKILIDIMNEEPKFADEFSRRVHVSMDVTLAIPDFPWSTKTLLQNLHFDDNELIENIDRPPFSRCTGLDERTRISTVFMRRPEIRPEHIVNISEPWDLFQKSVIGGKHGNIAITDTAIKVCLANPHNSLHRIVNYYGWNAVDTPVMISKYAILRPDVCRYLPISYAKRMDSGEPLKPSELSLLRRIVRHVVRMQKIDRGRTRIFYGP